ncbi:MAG: Hint domain-containing protein [Octadecabacter sp.]
MTLNWIGTRTQEDRVFTPAGLGCVDGVMPGATDILARGSLLIEVEVHPISTPVNLLRFGTLDPWPSGITVCLEPDGTLRLLMRHGKRHLATALKTTLGTQLQTAHITYTWDAPARKGRLSVHVPDHGHLWQTDVMAPFPLSMRDAYRMITQSSCVIDKGVNFAAIADAPCPHGPMPGLAGDAMIDMPSSSVAIRDITAGDFVNVQGARAMPVQWVGRATVPALGRFAPMTLRQPYMGLRRDLVTARDQRVCLAGSDVEYMFGEERVSTAARHLEATNCAGPTENPPPVMTYYQILLQTHEIITVNGTLIESFDGSAILAKQAGLDGSVLAGLPSDMRPRNVGLAAAVLQGYEAVTLTGVTAG